MRHRDDGDAEPELRVWFLREEKAFRRQMCLTLAEDPNWSQTAWEQLSGPINALTSGREYRFHGWQLPDEHWALVYGVNVDWMLDENDVLRPAQPGGQGNSPRPRRHANSVVRPNKRN